jgi:hypothetical protein
MKNGWKQLVAAAVVIAIVALPSAALAGKKPLVVGKDPKGDWGETSAPDPATQPAFAAAGSGLGQDLVSASIGMRDKKTVNFIIGLTALPPIGGTPEASRYSWNFMVNGKSFEIDGKFTNYSRGVCDPTAGSCPPPRDPGMQPFFLRGNCTQVQNLVTCEELALIQAQFDAAKATITIPVSLKLLKAKPGSKITGAAGTFGSTISAAPAAFLTYGDFPMDHLNTLKTFKVPR